MSIDESNKHAYHSSTSLKDSSVPLPNSDLLKASSRQYTSLDTLMDVHISLSVDQNFQMDKDPMFDDDGYDARLNGHSALPAPLSVSNPINTHDEAILRKSIYRSSLGRIFHKTIDTRAECMAVQNQFLAFIWQVISLTYMDYQNDHTHTSTPKPFYDVVVRENNVANLINIVSFLNQSPSPIRRFIDT
jgi:hypothetical protein